MFMENNQNDSEMSTKSNMFEVLPVELLEKILLYLTIAELYTFFHAIDKKYNILSDHFWRKVCLNEDFLKVNERLEWYECFERGVNKRLGSFVHCYDTPVGRLEHVCSTSLIVSDSLTSVYNVYSLNCKNHFELVQSIAATSVCFKDEFILAKNETRVIIYKYNWESNIFDVYRTFSEKIYDIFGISSKYCVVFHTKKKLFKIYFLCNGSGESTTLLLPENVKLVIEKILHLNNIVISTLTFSDGYRIKMYDITKSEWTLDLKCFTSTGITNDPNVWVGTNFIACCDVSYRLRGICFGPFIVWNKQGEKLFEAEIESSSHHYLRCFFKDNHVLLTTSYDCIKIFDSFGSHVSSIHTKTIFKDIKLSTGYLLFVLTKGMPSVDIYNWKDSCHLYSVSLTYECSNSLFSEFLYCPYNNNKYEVFTFG